jgi:hypothetical protein
MRLNKKFNRCHLSIQASTINKLKSDFGGDKRDRTADLLHAMQALSQLSYTPYVHIIHIA